MSHPTGESGGTALRVDFDCCLKLEFHGGCISSSNASLPAIRERCTGHSSQPKCGIQFPEREAEQWTKEGKSALKWTRLSWSRSAPRWSATPAMPPYGRGGGAAGPVCPRPGDSRWVTPSSTRAMLRGGDGGIGQAKGEVRPWCRALA
jgi:hypothetical protein